MSRPRFWGTVRLLAGAAILGTLVVRVGADPFVAGLRRTDTAAILIALLVTTLTTLACVWRWSLIAGRLGLNVPIATGVAAYYRSQFLNATLPGGVLGDVDRAIDHGRAAGDVGRSARAVGWERITGQVVQFMLAFGVLLALPSPVRDLVGDVVSGLGAAGVIAPALGGLLVGTALARLALVRLRSRTTGRTARGTAVRASGQRVRRRRGRRRQLHRVRVLGATVGGDLRDAVLARSVLPRLVLASVVASLGHVAVFVVAARTAGVAEPLTRLFPIALLVLLASAVPLNVAGWGPREGVAVWAFAATGSSATQGLTVAVVYGVLAFAATLPGAAVLLLGRRVRPAGVSVQLPALPAVTHG